MKPLSNQAILIFCAALGILLIYLLAPILTPFLFGTLLAYLLTPLAKRLAKWFHLPHIVSVVCVFVLFFGTLVGALLSLYPLIQTQILSLIDLIPRLIDWVQQTVWPWITEFVDLNTVKNAIPATLAKTDWLLSTVLKSSYTLIECIVNIVLIPVVTFYFLRDWDKILHQVNMLLPKSARPTVDKLANEVDDVLGGFFRGQLLVMLGLAIIYGFGLTLIGLKVGLMIGLIGGLLSIVPYLGSLFVVVTATAVSLVEIGTFESVLWAWGVFLLGQTLEGYLLTPYLVGERIGLHPVAVIFSVMAGGALFGFFGILVALPVASVVMVLLRFVNARYHASHFYNKR